MQILGKENVPEKSVILLVYKEICRQLAHVRKMTPLATAHFSLNIINKYNNIYYQSPPLINHLQYGPEYITMMKVALLL